MNALYVQYGFISIYLECPYSRQFQGSSSKDMFFLHSLPPHSTVYLSNACHQHFSKAQNIEEPHVRPASHSSQVITRCAASILRSFFSETLSFYIKSQHIYYQPILQTNYTFMHMHIRYIDAQRVMEQSKMSKHFFSFWCMQFLITTFRHELWSKVGFNNIKLPPVIVHLEVPELKWICVHGYLPLY